MKTTIKQAADWFTIGRLGILMLVLALPGIVVSYQRGNPGAIQPGRLVSESYVTFAWEMASIAFTILIIDRIYQIQAIRLEKAELLQQLRSTDLGLVVQAVERLRANGWLADGTLCGCSLDHVRLPRLNLSQSDFEGANLKEVDLSFTNLEGANLKGVDLEGANLERANLREASIRDAVPRGANLSQANLIGCEDIDDQCLSEAARLAYALLPDGQRYDGRFNLEGDLFAARLAGFRAGDEVAMARFYDVPVANYRVGQRRKYGGLVAWFGPRRFYLSVSWVREDRSQPLSAAALAPLWGRQ